MKNILETLIKHGVRESNARQFIEPIMRIINKDNFIDRDIKLVSHKDNKGIKNTILELFGVDFISKTNKEGIQKVRSYLGLPPIEKKVKDFQVESKAKLTKDIGIFYQKTINWNTISNNIKTIETHRYSFYDRLSKLNLRFQDEIIIKDRLNSIFDGLDKSLFVETYKRNK